MIAAALLLAAAPQVSSMTATEMTDLVRRIKPAVEQLRGLAFLRDVPVKLVDKKTAQAYFKSRAETFWPKERARSEQRLLIALGLLPKGYDIRDGLFDLLEDQVAGYYDPTTKTFFVLSDMPRQSAPLIIAHELTHALDDQHYDIDGLLARFKDDDDRQGAVSAVVEGSGTLVMTTYLVREVKAGRMTMDAVAAMQSSDAGRMVSLGASPAWLQRSLLAPYVVGQGFLVRGNLLALAAWTGGGDVDQAFRDMPASFEQILHPEKYWDGTKRDRPTPLRLGDLSAKVGDGYTLALSGSLGELGMAVMTGLGGVDNQSPSMGLLASWTNEAATGWDGDRYQLYTRGDHDVAVLATAWDTEKDAQEFVAAAGPGRFALREGTRVVVMAGDAADRREAVALAVLDQLRSTASQ